MGLYKNRGVQRSVSSYESSSPSASPQPAPNPNPNNYKIEQVVMEGKMLILKIKYPDCSNFEGMKILVYDNVNLADLINQGSIDPHFSNAKNFKSPIARFVPTAEGWQMALLFCQKWTEA